MVKPAKTCWTISIPRAPSSSKLAAKVNGPSINSQDRLMPPALLAPFPSLIVGWGVGFLIWFLIWLPVVALLEYATHRWIMHMANRLLDPSLSQLRAHGAHHQGTNGAEVVDMPWRNCLLLATPFLVLMAGWGMAVGSLASVVAPSLALLSWTLFYAYLWTRIHRAIHGVESNWFGRSPLFAFYRDHHLKHHEHATINYGTVFPWTDYL